MRQNWYWVCANKGKMSVMMTLRTLKNGARIRYSMNLNLGFQTISDGRGSRCSVSWGLIWSIKLKTYWLCILLWLRIPLLIAALSVWILFSSGPRLKGFHFDSSLESLIVSQYPKLSMIGDSWYFREILDRSRRWWKGDVSQVEVASDCLCGLLCQWMWREIWYKR